MKKKLTKRNRKKTKKKGGNPGISLQNIIQIIENGSDKYARVLCYVKDNSGEGVKYYIQERENSRNPKCKKINSNKHIHLWAHNDESTNMGFRLSCNSETYEQLKKNTSMEFAKGLKEKSNKQEELKKHTKYIDDHNKYKRSKRGRFDTTDLFDSNVGLVSIDIILKNIGATNIFQVFYDLLTSGTPISPNDLPPRVPNDLLQREPTLSESLSRINIQPSRSHGSMTRQQERRRLLTRERSRSPRNSRREFVGPSRGRSRSRERGQQERRRSPRDSRRRSRSRSRGRSPRDSHSRSRGRLPSYSRKYSQGIRRNSRGSPSRGSFR